MSPKLQERLFDLVRHQRAELHEAGLITDAEYAELAAAKGSVERLETYDDLRAEIEKLKSDRAADGLHIYGIGGILVTIAVVVSAIVGLLRMCWIK